MERFGRVLRRVDRELEVREPERSRILLELSGDLEELFRAYRRRGCSEEEARRRAEAWLAPDGASREGLRRLHTPLAGRLLRSLSEVGRSRLETAAFTVLALGSVAAGLWGLRGTVLLWPPGPAVAAVLAIGGTGLAVAARRATRLFLAADGAPPREAHLLSLPVLAAASFVVGALGACFEVGSSLAAAAAAPTTAAPSGAPELASAAVEGVGAGAPEALWGALASAAGTAGLGLVVALALTLAWFWLAVRARLVRDARAELRASVPHLDPGRDGRSR